MLQVSVTVCMAAEGNASWSIVGWLYSNDASGRITKVRERKAHYRLATVKDTIFLDERWFQHSHLAQILSSTLKVMVWIFPKLATQTFICVREKWKFRSDLIFSSFFELCFQKKSLYYQLAFQKVLSIVPTATECHIWLSWVLGTRWHLF